MFRALVLDLENDRLVHAVRNVDEADLPPGDVLVDVEYSSLNYKDGLAITGKGKIIRGAFPFVPGIDLAGTIAESDAPILKPGDRVIVTGWGVGEKYWGGYAAKARVRSEWIVRMPEKLSSREAMIIGTAGFTAMLAVLALEDHGAKPGDGEIVVSGATGGVGSIAVALLAKRGFHVVASTGSKDQHDFLTALGASRIIDREELPSAALKALDSSKWKGAIDTVGGATLAGIIAQLDLHASAAACGNASGFDLKTTVFPFILRGANLLGIDSNYAPLELRRRAWERLATDLDKKTLAKLTAAEIGLDALALKAEAITNGEIDGRVVVDVRR
ncbi:MAG: MDR family oxidoreductase [Thermoanaerobaculia bacterium]